MVIMTSSDKQPAQHMGAIDRVPPNPFDLDNLRVTGDVTSIGAEKILTGLQVRKPNRQEFYRINPDPDYCLPCAILELKEEREHYLVTPGAVSILSGELRFVEMRLCKNRQGALFLWPLPLPDADGRINSWHESAREAAELAKNSWVRMVANMSAGGYDVYKATGSIPDPEWPKMTFQELLELAFKGGKLIDSEDHPVVKQLYGA
jgi:hypothetical protein